MKILITGCCGFMASHLIEHLSEHNLIGVDKIASPYSKMRFDFVRPFLKESYFMDINKCEDLFGADLVINMAAETFVDSSIKDPAPFLSSNILGTEHLLRLCINKNIRFIQVSTDEVYGPSVDYPFMEHEPLRPGNPYSATKASADMLCMAYANTYKIPITIIRPENNYGERQSPEKAIPRWIRCLINNQPLPVYGDGKHRRMWLNVKDFCRAVELIISKGEPGQVYNIGGNDQRENLEVVNMLNKSFTSGSILFLDDETARPGHDRSYCVDTTKLRNLGFAPQHTLEVELPKIVEWYKQNPEW